MKVHKATKYISCKPDPLFIYSLSFPYTVLAASGCVCIMQSAVSSNLRILSPKAVKSISKAVGRMMINRH